MVLHNTCIMQGDAISRKLDLSLDESGGKRNRDELRKLLQMRDCLSIRDASREAARIRDALCEKLWLEKQTGKVWWIGAPSAIGTIGRGWQYCTI